MRLTNTRRAMAELAKESPDDPQWTYREVRDLFVAAYVADVVRHCEWSKREASEILDVSYSLVKEIMSEI